MKAHPLLRLAIGFALLAAGFAAGRWWHGDDHADHGNGPASETPAAATTRADPAAVEAARVERLLAELAAIADDARRMPEPDARTLGFFEQLPLADLPPVVDWIDRMPSGNEQDALFVIALRRWGELDGPGALARAAAIDNIVTREGARGAAYQSWSRRDAQAAYTRALEETDHDIRHRALAAVLPGAAIAYPGGAITFWENAPPRFRESSLGLASLERIVDAAYGTGQREAVQAIIQGLPMGEERLRLVVALARNWGVHYPDEARSWLATVLPEGAMRSGAIDAMFDAYVRKDPPRAAEWALQRAEPPRRASYVAAAIAEWAELDSDGAEMWINEQIDAAYLDGASYAMAAHFIERRNLTRAFAWIRRINRGEARAEMLGNLGRIWSTERPDEFKQFLAETSLNPVEVEMLMSKVASTPPS